MESLNYSRNISGKRIMGYIYASIDIILLYHPGLVPHLKCADSAVLLYLLLHIECQDQLPGFPSASLNREMGCAGALSEQSDS